MTKIKGVKNWYCSLEMKEKFGTSPPLQSPGVARDGLPGGGGRRSPSDGVPGGGGGGIARVSQGKLPSSVTTGFGFKKASNVDCKLRFRGTFAAIVGCVGCAGVWGCGDMGVTSGDFGDLGDSTATASSLDS